MITSILLSGVIATLGYWYYWRWKNRRLLELSGQLPGPKTYPLFGNALVFMANPRDHPKMLSDIFVNYGDYVRFWLGPDLIVGVKNPADIRALLTGSKVNQKGALYYFTLNFLGPGLLSGGPTWRKHRKLANPTYNKKSVQHFLSIFNEEAKVLTQKLLKKDPNVKFDVYHDVVQCTTQCVCQTLMGLSKEDSQNVYRLQDIIKNTQNIYELIFLRMTRWWYHIPFIYFISGNQCLENKYMKLIDDVTTDIVNKRRRSMKKNGIMNEEKRGVIDRFIMSGELSEKDLKEETFTVFTTSQEAAAKIGSAMLLFLARLPHWQDAVYSEIQQICQDDVITKEHLKQMVHLDAVFKEATRYLSIASMIQRTVEEDVTVNDGKITIPAGASVLIPIQDLHRDPRYWEDPQLVRPERFMPENMKNRDPNTFLPFSLGPMDCLGQVFAPTMIKTMVIQVLRQVHLETDEVLEHLELQNSVSVRFTNGYNLRARPRKPKMDTYNS